MLTRISYWIPFIVWCGVIFFFSTLSVGGAATFDLVDFIFKKSAHIIEYFIFFVLLYRALKNTTRLSNTNIAIVCLICVFLYGLSDEFHQSFTPGREPRLRDVMIDTTGGVLAWITLWKLLPKMPKKLKILAEKLQVN